MPNLGISELIVILLILLLVFGGSRLPQIGESLGRTARSFKRGIASNDAIKVDEVNPSPEAKAEPQQLKPQTAGSNVEREIEDAELIEKKG